MRAQKTETETRQEQIIEAALELVGAEGVNALSIAGIAERVGIVPSAIYRHFESKDDVLDAVLESIKKKLLGNLTQVRKEIPGALPRLKSIFMRQIRMLSENRAIPLVVFSDGIYAGHPDRKAKVAAIITTYLDKIQKIIEEGMLDGSIRKDVVPATASIMFLGMILPAAVLWNVSGGNFDIDAHGENGWTAFVRSIENDT